MEKKVLLAITRPTIGGDTNVVMDIARFLSQKSWHVTVLAGPVMNGEVDWSHKLHQPAVEFKLVRALRNQINPLINLNAVLLIYRFITDRQFDVVHTHSSVAGIIGRLAARLARTPVIVHHVHGWGLRPGMSWPERTLYIGLESLCAGFTDRLIAVSSLTMNQGLQQRIGHKEQYEVIYNGIDLDRFKIQFDQKDKLKELGLPQRGRIIGLIGRLDPQKNPFDFIRAARIVKEREGNAYFVIVGEGKLRSECELLIRELGLGESVFLLGYRTDIDEILPHLSITVLSSLWEGLPVVIQESFAAGKPVISTDVGGVRDIVRHGHNGFLVSPGDYQGIANHILELLHDRTLLARMSGAAKGSADRFSVGQMTRRIEDLYLELLDAKS